MENTADSEAATDLSFMFDKPLSAQDRLLKQEAMTETAENSDEPLPEASAEEIGELVEAAALGEEEQLNKASWGDVIKSGGIRAPAGFAQGFMALAETTGLLDKGTTADFTKQILAYENAGEMELAKQLTRDMLANSIPLVAEVLATRGTTLPTALKRSSAIGASGGFFSFVENPEQASTTSMARFMNTTLGATLGPVVMGTAASAGRLFSYLRGTRAEQSVGAPDLVPERAVADEGAETIEQASEKGITLSPGAATGDPALLAQEMKAGGAFSDQTQRFLADTIGVNAKNTQELLDELVNTIIPEGKAGIKEAVGTFYEAASKDIMPQEIAAPFRKNKVIEDIISKTIRDPASKAAYDSFAPNSIGRFNFVIKELQKKIDDAAGTDTAAYLIDLKRQMQKAASGVSDNYKLAVDASQRDKTAMEVLEALTREGSSEVIPSTNHASSFVSNFSNKNVKEKMALGIKSLSDPKQRAEALKKMEFLLNILPKVSNMEKTVESYLKTSSEEVAKRSQPAQALFYTLDSVLNSNNNEAYIRFILDPTKSAARLRELMPKRNTSAEENAKALGIIMGEVLEESAEGFTEVPYRLGEREAIETSSISSKAKAYEKLAQSGRLDELMIKNPEAYKALSEAHTARAMV